MDGGLFIGFPEEGKPMKRYFLLSCIVAIMPIGQSVSASAADLGFAPAPTRAPYAPRTFNWSGGPSAPIGFPSRLNHVSRYCSLPPPNKMAPSAEAEKPE